MRRSIFIAFAFLFFCSWRAEAEWLDPLDEIYWQGTAFAGTGAAAADSAATCSGPENGFPPVAAARPATVKPAIAIIIDDMGVDRNRSARATLLPPEVTLAYLPYALHVADQTRAARRRGHPLIVHMPMEPDRRTANPGPDVLETGLSPLELHRRITANLGAFGGYDGVNNHMGSRFSRDEDGLRLLMAELKSRGLFFIDSKTIAGSAAEKIAREAGIPTTHRDVFIDHYDEPEKIAQALQKIEIIANRTGSAVAIGHPRDATLDALEKWLPSLAEKGFHLATLEEVIALREERRKLAAPSSAAARAAKSIPAKASSPH
jgi:polysaccharide deacetylase 2 family uncharacterized protein YibQ